MSDRLIKIYQDVLEFAGLSVDKDGWVSVRYRDRSDPFYVDGKQLVLPTHYHLKTSSDNKVIFHPLTENIFGKESSVLEKLKQAINTKLNYVFGVVGSQLIHLAASTDKHAQLNPDQADLLIALKDADDTAFKSFTTAMIAGIKENPDRCYVNIYLKKGGRVRGQKMSRVGIVTFPAYEELRDSKKKTLNGTKIRVKDKEIYEAFYRFVFPDITVPETYNIGSDSLVAPYFDALMQTAMAVARRLEDVIDQYSDYIDQPDAVRFNGEWVEAFNNLSDLVSEIRKIPMQEGNQGQEERIIAPPQPMMRGPQPAMPPVAPEPEIRRTSRGIDFHSTLERNPSLIGGPNPLGHMVPSGPPYTGSPGQYLPPPQYPPAYPSTYPTSQMQPVYPPPTRPVTRDQFGRVIG